MVHFSKKKKKKPRLRFTGMFLLFCLFLHVLNATASGLWCEAGLRNRLGSVSPLLQTPPTFLPLGAALSALSFPSPGLRRARLWRLPRSRWPGRGSRASSGVPATGQCFPPSGLCAGFSRFPGGSVPSFSLKPWSGPPQVGPARPAGRDPPLVTHLWWGSPSPGT